MMLFCISFCAILATGFAQGGHGGFYAPQTFKDPLKIYQQDLFMPATNEIMTKSSNFEPWTQDLSWKPVISNTLNTGPVTFTSAQPSEPWRPGSSPSKERQAAIVHHKQALSSDGNFRFEYVSDNGLAAGEVIQPDGTRLGAYQYRDPSGQLVKLKYRAGKEGFQILEGSHVPKSVEPQTPPRPENHYKHAYEQQRKQYELQQNYNRKKPQQLWSGQSQYYIREGGTLHPASGQYFLQNRQVSSKEDDGQYRENDLEEDQGEKRPHNFGEGYAFSFEG